jgi:DNA-binding FadR family transcriptional regulator
MTRKHFEAIAAALKASNASMATVQAMCDVLAGMNPRFDTQRFIAACGH